MEFYTPRKLKFKAWDKESKLLMRLNSIECVKGELVKKNHVLLQFTEMTDQHGEELYEMDIILWGSNKYVIVWSDSPAGWYLLDMKNSQYREALTQQQAATFLRLGSYFELEKP